MSLGFLKKIFFIAYSWVFSFFFLNLFIYFWLCWVLVSVWGLSLLAASGGHSSSRCAGLSLSRPLPLRSTGSRRAGSVVVAHGLSCSTACGIFPDQGSNPCPLHWQADSQPLRHQGSPESGLLKKIYIYIYFWVLDSWKYGKSFGLSPRKMWTYTYHFTYNSRGLMDPLKFI